MKRSRTAFVLGLAVLVLSACSQDPVPKVAPHESPAPSVSESASSSSPADPVQAVKAWVTAQNLAFDTGNTAVMRSLSSTPCQACDDFIEPIEKVFKAGGSIQTRGWIVEGAKARSRSTNPVAVDAAITISGGTTVRRAGAQPVAYKAEKHMMLFKVVPDGDSWVVSFIGFIS